VQSAFNTQIDSVTAGSATGYANVTPAQIPAGLGSTVAAVLGLSDVFSMSLPDLLASAATNPASSCTVQGVGYLCDYNPQGLQLAYDATRAPTGSKTTEAIFAEGDLTQVVTDLRTEEKANKLPKVPVTIDHTGIASTDTSGADEWDLDTQYSTGMAQTVKNLRLYDATSLSDSDLAIGFADFAGQDKAKAGSASFGECEALAYLDGSMVVDDESFAEAAAQGQTVFASAGDTGGFCTVAPTNGVPAGIPDVEYPAASPYVVAVGGTTLLTNADGSYDEEAAWLAGGGGPSYFESAPSWQASDGVIGTIGSTVDLRTVPDVSMDADPNSGANVYVDGTPETVGGTSLASPLSLGVWDRLESGHGNALPFASPQLYALNGTTAFHDVTLGDNGPYPATPGYDLATGIGSFDVAQAETLIK
jgi:pseudomonalisin